MNIRIIQKSLTYCLLVLFVFVAFSCDNFLDVNDDPNAATEAPGDFLFSEASAVLQSNRNIELGSTVPFFIQTFASNNSAGGLFMAPERYNVGPSDFAITNNFGGIYTNVLNNLALYIRDIEGSTPARPNAVAQARLVRDYTFYYLTTLFGDVPFSEANDPNIDAPAFDNQQDILDSLVVRIDDSIDMINTGDQSDAIGTADLFYKGDMDKWLRFANSLKLRILMLQYNTDTSVASEIQSLINNPNLIRSNDANFRFPYFEESGRENQMFQLHADFAGGEPGFFYAGEVLVDEMNADNDPRRQIMFDTNYAGNYVGVPAGETETDSLVSTLGSAITIPTFPGRILGASETLLHEAEFLAKEGSFVQARSKLEGGIRASINYLEDSTPVSISQSDKDTYVQDILSDYDTASNAGKVEEIQLQLYIDLFEQVPENWTNWKRTKVPSLDLPNGATLGSVIRRLPISAEEIAANPNAPDQVPLDTPMSFEE
jgi:hypothetical protein